MKNRHYYLAAIIQSTVLIMASPPARAEDPTTDGYVTRKEYEELKAQLLAMKNELDAIKKEKSQETAKSHAVADVHKEVASKQENTQGQIAADTHKEVATSNVPSVAELEASLFGTTKFLLA